MDENGDSCAAFVTGVSHESLREVSLFVIAPFYTGHRNSVPHSKHGTIRSWHFIEEIGI